MFISITLPMHEVLCPSASSSVLSNFFNLIFLFLINNCWRWYQFLMLTLEFWFHTLCQDVICKSTHLEITFLWWSHFQNIQACLPQWPSFSQHVLWQCCNHPGILSSTAEIILFNLVFHDRVTPVSVSTLKPLLGVIGVLPLKFQVSPILSVCI